MYNIRIYVCVYLLLASSAPPQRICMIYIYMYAYTYMYIWVCLLSSLHLYSLYVWCTYIYTYIFMCIYEWVYCYPPLHPHSLYVCPCVSACECLCVPVSLCVCLSLLYKSAQQKLSSFPKETYQFRSTHVSMPENEKKERSSSNLPLPVSPLQKQGPPPPPRQIKTTTQKKSPG